MCIRDSPWTHPIVYCAGREIGWELINSQNNNAFQAFSKTYMRLVKDMKSGKEFIITPMEKTDVLEPLDIKLLEKLRKKYNL